MNNMKNEWPFIHANCKDCTLNTEREVPPYIPSTYQYKILLVGMGPGKEEALPNNPQSRQPFIGPAGKMLYSILKQANLLKKNLAITNIVSCQLPNDREPTQHEIQCCHNRLEAEIQYIKPDLIIALGGPSAAALTGVSKKITHLRGSVHPLSGFHYSCDVLITFHPSFVMRQRQWIPVAVSDMEKAVSYLSSNKANISIQEPSPMTFITNPSQHELQKFFEEMRPDDILTFDVETTGLNPRQDSFLGIAYCYNTSKAIAVDTATFKRDEHIHKAVLTDKNIKKNVQNGSFDYSFLNPMGIKVQGIYHDTRLAETLIHSDLPKDLQALRAYYTNIPAYKPSKREMQNIQKLGRSKIAEIGCWDVITTHAVMEKQLLLLNDKEKAHLHNLLIPLIEVFDYMMSKGIRIDINRLAYLYKKEHDKIQSMLPTFEQLGINPNSPKQIADRFGLTDSQVDTLTKLIKRNHPQSQWFQLILDYRTATKAASTFLKGPYMRQENGRVHTTYKIEGTGTGRPSSTEPNLTNVPDFYRQIYIPEEGHYLCECDFSQLELRIGALLGPEPKLLQMMDDGVDVHEIVRCSIFGPNPKPEEQSRQRFMAKSVVFGTFYGRSARSIAIEYNVSIQEAEKWQSIAINQFPGLLQYKKRCENDLHTKGYVETPFGRRRYISTMTQGYNTPVQSSAADVGLTTLLRLYKAGFDIRLTVYDSFLANIKTKDDAIEMKHCCEQPFEIFDNYSFKAKAKYGSSWYFDPKEENVTWWTA